MEEVPNIPSFFRGQHVLVTGATGYLGKAVVEKLLRCCSDVEKITVLVRQKRDQEPQKGLQEYLNDMVFERMKREKPGATNKVEVVSGDLMAVGLGLSPEDRQMVEQKVSIIIHSGATVRFDEPLKKALAVNTRGTLEIANLAKKMTNLKVLVHVSTAFCNCDRYEIDEVIYPAPCDWKMLLSAMDHVDDHTFNILTPKILGRLPNTYTFTKALAEHLVKDVAKDLPVVIFRPTIVLPALQEPFPGWVDNFNGPVGLLIAGGLALASTAYGNPKSRHNFVAVDQVINALLVASWEKAVLSKHNLPTVINVARSTDSSPQLKEYLDNGVKALEEIPSGYCLWTPNTYVTTANYYRYYFNVLFFHFILSLFIDSVIQWFHLTKLSLLALQRKIHYANLSLSYFSLNEWNFKNQNLHWLRTTILPEDRKTFDFDRFEEPIDVEYMKLFYLGSRRFLLKLHDSSIPDHLAHNKRVVWAVRIYYILLFLGLCWAAYKYYAYYSRSVQI